MGDLNSDQYAIQIATDSSVDKIPYNEFGVTPKRYKFSLTTTGSFGASVGDIINLIKLPGSPTGVRIFVDQCSIQTSVDPAGKGCLGLAEYTNIAGSTISENFSALAVLTGSAFDQEPNTIPSIVVSYGASVGGAGDRSLLVDCREGVTVILGGSTATSVFSMATGTTVKGWIVAG